MNDRRAIACIVEGHGEIDAVPILIRRIAAVLDPPVAVADPFVLRRQRDKLVKQGELEKAVELSARRVGPGGPILILIDAEDDCPATLGPRLLERALKARNDRKIAVVLAKREFEAWFLAAAASLRGQRGLSRQLEAPDQPEEIRGAKEWLSRHKVDGTRYSPVIDQPELTAAFEFSEASRSDSFQKCRREIVRLLG